MRKISKERAEELQHKWKVTNTELKALLKAKVVEVDSKKAKA